MTNFKMLKPIGQILRHINIESIKGQIAGIDLKSDDAKEQVGMLIISLITEKLADIADPVVELCAAYKGVSVEEIEIQSPFIVLKELFEDEEFTVFFKRAAQTDLPK